MDRTCETKESCFEKMVSRLKGSIPQIIGVALGGIAGFMYYYKIGCSSGTCPITSNPWISTIWGAVMGYLLVDLFSSKQKNK